MIIVANKPVLRDVGLPRPARITVALGAGAFTKLLVRFWCGYPVKIGLPQNTIPVCSGLTQKIVRL